MFICNCNNFKLPSNIILQKGDVVPGFETFREAIKQMLLRNEDVIEVADTKTPVNIKIEQKAKSKKKD